MELKDIVTISGKSGLFKIVKPTRVGFVLEALDNSKQKMVTNPRQKVSVLDEISIYTDESEGSVPLKDVLDKIYSEYKNETGVTPSSTPQEMRDFLQKVVPKYDEERVYTSDIKKLITWYMVLIEHGQEIFQNPKTKQQPKSKDSKAVKEGPSKAAKKGPSKAASAKKDNG